MGVPIHSIPMPMSKLAQNTSVNCLRINFDVPKALAATTPGRGLTSIAGAADYETQA
jgi:hypothetical protein